MTTPGAGATVDRFLAAYNAKDLATIADLLREDVSMVHFGRGVEAHGRDEVLARLAQSATGTFPDRRFGPARRRHVAGSHVIVEHDWEATATTDAPGFAAAGERVTLELCTIFTLRDGLIAEYTEYG